MLNICDIVGVVRDKSDLGLHVQFDNVKAHNIPVSMRPRDRYPKWLKNGVNVKVRGRLLAALEDTERVVRVEALGLDHPSTVELPPLENYNRMLREGQEANDPERVSKLYGPSKREDRFRTGGSFNNAEIAGFLVAMVLERPGAPRADGGRNDGLLTLGIRQTNDVDDILPVRIYSPRVVAIAESLSLGAPLYVKGRVEVRLKNVGEPDPETGNHRTAKYPFVRTNILRGALPGEHIKIDTPGWALDLQQEEADRRTLRARRRMREETDDGAITEVASESAPPLAASGLVDPSLLHKLREAAPPTAH
jgi:hypothetical protein